MNHSERQMIKDKLQKSSDFIRSENRKPKDERNLKAVQVAKTRTETFKRWLNEN